MQSVTEQIVELFDKKGDEAYFGENVSQLEHALQSAALAVEAGADNTLVVAALLHDIGHLTHEEGEDAADRGIDTRHEDDGEAWLSQYFPPSVTEPIKLHVAAKRYLCATDSQYLSILSEASVKSLELQGGPMSEQEVAEFEANPFYKEAVELRRWDDTAKVVGLEVPTLEFYVDRIRAVQLPEPEN